MSCVITTQRRTLADGQNTSSIRHDQEVVEYKSDMDQRAPPIESARSAQLGIDSDRHTIRQRPRMATFDRYYGVQGPRRRQTDPYDRNQPACGWETVTTTVGLGDGLNAISEPEVYPRKRP
jgi:hypothetical protein